MLYGYNQLINGFSSEWKTCLQELLDTKNLTFTGSQTRSPENRIAHLKTDVGALIYMQSNAPMTVTGINGPSPMLIITRSGTLTPGTFDSDILWVSAWQKVTLSAHAHFTQLIIRKPSFELSRLTVDRPPLTSLQCLRQLEEDYRLSTLFFSSHTDALEKTKGFISQALACLIDPVKTLKRMEAKQVDPRVQRIIDFIIDNPDWEFSLSDLIELTHTSERTLYNLMKAHTGLTPYKFFIQQRLVRLRNTLLLCNSDSPSISWHALNHGFNHLGRLPRQYFEYLGERPSDTLAWRQWLHSESSRNQSREVQRDHIHDPTCP